MRSCRLQKPIGRVRHVAVVTRRALTLSEMMSMLCQLFTYIILVAIHTGFVRSHTDSQLIIVPGIIRLTLIRVCIMHGMTRQTRQRAFNMTFRLDQTGIFPSRHSNHPIGPKHRFKQFRIMLQQLCRHGFVRFRRANQMPMIQ